MLDDGGALTYARRQLSAAGDMVEILSPALRFDEITQEEREVEWRRGFWLTREGKRVPFVDMEDEHLTNAVMFLRRKRGWPAEGLLQYELLMREAERRGLSLPEGGFPTVAERTVTGTVTGRTSYIEREQVMQRIAREFGNGFFQLDYAELEQRFADTMGAATVTGRASENTPAFAPTVASFRVPTRLVSPSLDPMGLAPGERDLFGGSHEFSDHIILDEPTTLSPENAPRRRSRRSEPEPAKETRPLTPGRKVGL